MEIENTADTNMNNELTDTLLNVSDLKQSLKDIVHYHNYVETANPEVLYIMTTCHLYLRYGKGPYS